MKAIIAVNNLGFIGLRGDLPWGRNCKEDLKHFKKLTEVDNILFVGYNTFQTLPQVVKNRAYVLVDDRPVWTKEQINRFNIDWCIGGKRTYEKYCHLFTELHISHIDDNSIGDTLFPNFKNLNKDCKIFNYYFKLNK